MPCRSSSAEIASSGKYSVSGGFWCWSLVCKDIGSGVVGHCIFAFLRSACVGLQQALVSYVWYRRWGQAALCRNLSLTQGRALRNAVLNMIWGLTVAHLISNTVFSDLKNPCSVALRLGVRLQGTGEQLQQLRVGIDWLDGRIVSLHMGFRDILL